MTLPIVYRQRRAAALFIGPFLTLFVLVTLAPLAYSLWLSLFSEKSSGLGFGGVERTFVGLGNYVSALSDQAFRSGFGVIGTYIAIYVPLLICLALLLALILDSGAVWGRQAAQLALFLPHAVPGLIAALIWLYLYTPGLSPVIGTASGALVDTEALTQELVSGRLHGVIDVTEPEVLPADSPLYDLPDVLLTPHIAGSLGGELTRLVDHALDELERYGAGRAFATPVHRELLSQSA